MVKEIKQTRLKLKSLNDSFKCPFETGSLLQKVYVGAHNDGRVVYDFEIQIEKTVEGFLAKANLGAPCLGTENDSLERLSTWMKKASEAIDNHLNGKEKEQ